MFRRAMILVAGINVGFLLGFSASLEAADASLLILGAGSGGVLSLLLEHP